MRRFFSMPLGLALLILAAGLASGPAQARAPRPVAAAKAHFKQGRAYQEAGAWADAIREYEKAYALTPLPELLYNIGQCHRLAGDKPKAIVAYQRFLDLAPEHALADEARNHLATLKLRIQVEVAEAATRRAREEAAAAQRRALEAEEAKRRTADEVARQLQAKRDQEERQRRLAAEAADRTQRRKEAAERDRQRRLAEALKQGKALRAGGIVAMVVGSVAIGLAIVAGVAYDGSIQKLDQWNHAENGPWSASLDWTLVDLKQQLAGGLGLGIGGTALLVTGIVLYRVGVSRRRRALEAVPRSVTVQPLLGPGTAGLSLQGSF